MVPNLYLDVRKATRAKTLRDGERCVIKLVPAAVLMI
jgi:hypothetical protein